MAAKTLTIRVPEAIMARLKKATDKKANPYSPRLTDVAVHGLELALDELEGKTRKKGK